MNRDEYHSAVYDLVDAIPEGCVATYGQIAALLGNPRAARRVGYALSRAPADRGLPCHRVINRRGEMLRHGAFGGPDRQRALLEHEGVRFRPDGRVDLASSLWRPLTGQKQRPSPLHHPAGYRTMEEENP